MIRSAFKPKLPPRPSRDRGDEFASFKPQARAAAPSTGLILREPALLTPLRPPTAKTQAEAAYMGRVAALGCAVCRLLGFGQTGAQVHHVRSGQGMAQRAGNYCVIGLCAAHHTGTNGVHGDKGCLRAVRCSEMDLLDITIGELAQ